MRKREEVLGQQNMWKLIARMAIPCILAQLVNLLYSIVDRIYIGNMADIGKDALAGLGLCTPIITFIAAFSAFVSGGGAPLASRYLGCQDKKRAQKILGNSATLLLIFSIVLAVITYSIKKPLLYAIGASDVTFTYANDYLSIYLMGTVFVQLGVGLNTFITAQGKSKLAMIATVLGAVFNIVLDPLFIFGFSMGIQGAALATILSQAISAFFVIYILLSPKSVLRLSIKTMKPELKIIQSILTLGIAQFVMTATESIIGFVLNGRLKAYGGDIHVSNLAILQSVMMLVGIPVTGFTQGVMPIMSYSYGAQDKERLMSCFKKTFLICCSYMLVFTVLTMVFPYPFARMFTSDSELIQLSVKYMPIFMTGMTIFGMQRACQTAFVSVGEAFISLSIAILRKIVFLVPFAYLFSYLWGVTGVYIAECSADALSATLCIIIFIFRFRKILARIDPKEKE